MEQAAVAGPILICLDDLHWADSATAAVLRALPDRLTTIPVGWVLATRPGPAPIEIRNAIDRLIRSGGEKIDVGPLDKHGLAHGALVSSGAVTSRRTIFPVGPLGRLSTSHSRRGYL